MRFASAVVAAGVLVGAPLDAGRSRGTLGAPNPEIVETARQAPLVRYHRDLPGGAYTNMGNSGGGAIIMAYAALAGNTSVDERLLEQIRYTLTGGNDIAANGGYPAQHELQVTGMLAVVKRIFGISSSTAIAIIPSAPTEAFKPSTIPATGLPTYDRCGKRSLLRTMGARQLGADPTPFSTRRCR